MTFQQELTSWTAPGNPNPSSPPSLGAKAPQLSKLPLASDKPTILTFLRHCGCPFAEKTFLNLRETARAHSDINFIAISHSSEEATQSWLKALPQHGSESANLSVVNDSELEIYHAWGLGVSGYAHVLSLASMWSVWRLGKEEGIWNRPTESGSRWQKGGSFAVDAKGIVRWGGVAGRADEIPEFEAAARAVEGHEAESKL